LNNIIISCEHAGNTVPEEIAPILSGCSAVVNSHEGYDIGALEIAKGMAAALDSPLFYHTFTRLAIDVNRSLTNPHCFSRYTAGLSTAKRNVLRYSYYYPYRQKLLEALEEMISRTKSVIHLSIHTFVPILKGEVRTADIGILFDPSRAGEKDLAMRLGNALEKHSSSMHIKYNYPYTGISDGIASAMRKIFNGVEYRGIELEINQQLCTTTVKQKECVEMLAECFRNF